MSIFLTLKNQYAVFVGDILMTDFNIKKIYAKIYFNIDKFVYDLRIFLAVRDVSFVKGKIYHLFLINVIL